METIEYTYREAEKAKWGEGPWQGEPDKIQWTDEATGLPCLVVRGPMGAWCGYVGVTEDHLFFGQSYDFVMGYNPDWSERDGESVDHVHGGLTFNGFCVEDDKKHGICHVPGPGEPDRVWWFGFDCGHMNDLIPAMVQYRREIPELGAIYDKPGNEFMRETYRTLEYVQTETRSLAKQLADIGGA